MKKCRNCANRWHRDAFGSFQCIGYEMACSEEEEIEQASMCSDYKEVKIGGYEYDDYTPSSTMGDYSPSNPWDAPGMSIRDFI